MKDIEGVPYNYYDYTRSWDRTNAGWHEVLLDNVSSFKHIVIVKWLYDRLDNPERHCRWIRFENGSGFKFRYERDCILFKLSWL